MTPLEERFRQRIELFKEQQTGVSKDKNLKKRLEKLQNKNDFQQQRLTDYTKVKNIASKIKFGTGPRLFGFGVEGINGQLSVRARSDEIGRLKPVNEIKSGGPKSYFGAKMKVLEPGKKWTTSGYQSMGTSLTDTKQPEPAKKKKRTSLKNRIRAAGTIVGSQAGFSAGANSSAISGVLGAS